MMDKAYKRIYYLNLFIVIVVAFNLRAPITALGPIAEMIKEYFDINYTLIGIVNSLPLFTFGFLSFFVGYFSPLRAMLGGICLIAIGELVRSYTGINGLFLGTFLLGCGIAIANVLVPSLIKQKFPDNVTKMMGIYGMMLGISSMAGIALSLPLVYAFGVKYALFFWGIFAVLALLVYYPQIKNKRFFRKKQKQYNKIHLFKNTTAWKITLFMGTQSFLAYSLFAWLALIIKSKGFSIEASTNLILLAQIIGLPVAFLTPLLFGKIKEKFKLFYVVGLCFLYVLSFFIIVLSVDKYIVVIGVCLMSIPWGGAFTIALFFIAHKSKNHFIAAKLSSFAQGFGYLLASTSSIIIGYLYDYFKSFEEILIFFIFISILLCLFGYFAYKSKIIS